VPESKKRAKDVYKPPRNLGKPESTNPKWLVPTMLTLLVGGITWILAYYVSGGDMPLNRGDTNIFIGFGLMMTGFVLATRWK